MQREISFDRIDILIEELKKQNITKLAFAEIHEKRALEVEPDVLQVGDLIQLEILAYRDSTIFKCKIMNADFESIHDMLASQGFEIVRRSRNIT